MMINRLLCVCVRYNGHYGNLYVHSVITTIECFVFFTCYTPEQTVLMNNREIIMQTDTL